MTHVLCVPDLPEAVLKKSGIDLSIQVEMLLKKVKMWEEIDSHNRLKQAIYRFFSAVLLQVPQLKLEIAHKKM